MSKRSSQEQLRTNGPGFGMALRVGPSRLWPMSAPLVLVTGVTGYIGGRLVPELLAAGYRVRAMARSPRRLQDREWYDDIEVVEADAGDKEQLAAAMDGVDIGYYLIHSLGTGKRFESRDRRMAL